MTRDARSALVPADPAYPAAIGLVPAPLGRRILAAVLDTLVVAIVSLRLLLGALPVLFRAALAVAGAADLAALVRSGEGPRLVPIDTASDSHEDAGSPVVLAGLTRVFANEDSLVMAQVEPTLPHLIPLIEGALDELLDSAVVRIEHREWRSAGVEPRLLAERAESSDQQRGADADR